MEDKESVRLSCLKYVDTVGFFAVLFAELEQAGLQVHVERDFEVPGSSEARPDFAVLDGNDITDVLEHKASLPSPHQALVDLTAVHKRYSRLALEGVISQPQVSVLYPVEKQDIADAIEPDLPSDLTLCSFDQTARDTEIRFKPKGKVRSQPLKAILDGSPIVYRPELVHSKYRFVRADPPPVYSAFVIWQLLPTFQTIRTARDPSFIVDRRELLKRALVFYPPWIRNNLQVNSNRVNQGLTFLDEIDFVDWRQGEEDVVVYRTRGSRSGDLLEHFSEKWVALRRGRFARRVSVLAESQKTLTDFE